MLLLQEAYCHFTMKANWLMPKADAEAALNVIQESFSEQSGRRQSHRGGRRWEEHRQGKGEGQDEDDKELSYLDQKRIVLLLKEFVHPHLPLLPQASLSGGCQQPVPAVSTGCCCYHDYRCDQILEPFKKLVGDLLEVGKGGTKTYWTLSKSDCFRKLPLLFHLIFKTILRHILRIISQLRKLRLSDVK